MSPYHRLFTGTGVSRLVSCLSKFFSQAVEFQTLSCCVHDYWSYFNNSYQVNFTTSHHFGLKSYNGKAHAEFFTKSSYLYYGLYEETDSFYKAVVALMRGLGVFLLNLRVGFQAYCVNTFTLLNPTPYHSTIYIVKPSNNTVWVSLGVNAGLQYFP